MYANGILNRQQISLIDGTEFGFQPTLIGRHDLISHRLAALSIDGNQRLTWVLPTGIACQWNNDHA